MSVRTIHLHRTIFYPPETHGRCPTNPQTHRAGDPSRKDTFCLTCCASVFPNRQPVPLLAGGYLEGVIYGIGRLAGSL